MRATYALNPPVVPVKSATSVDLLVAFLADAAGKARPKRRPLNLGLVIDRSGSMAGKSLQHALQAAETLVGQMHAEDVLSVVVYDDEVKTIIAPERVTDKKDLASRLRGVRAGGTTNLHGGWLQGCKHVLTRAAEPMIHRVLLLTDGQANVGVTDPKKLIPAARQQAEAGVVTTTLGFGAHFNEDLLIGMAEAAGGNFYFIETPEDATRVFEIEGESLASVVAQNLTVTLRPAKGGGGATVREVLNNYPAETAKDGTTVITVGDVYAGEEKLLAIAVDVPAAAKAQRGLPLFDMSYTFDPVAEDGAGGGAAGTGKGELAVSAAVVSADDAKEARPDGDMLTKISRIRIARAKEAAVEQADAKKFAAAGAALRQVIADLRAQGLEEQFEIAEEIAQLEHFAERIEQKQFDAGSRKEMRDQSYQGRTRGRADLSARGGSGGSAAGLETTPTADGGVELECVREGGKLRMRAASPGYNPNFHVQFPRNIREAGVHYVADALETSKDGTFYRVVGKVRRLARPGDPDPYAAGGAGRGTPAARSGPAKASKVSARSAADLETTDTVGTGVLVQCVKDGSKLRARVVSDGYNPDYNMRFPRDIREEGTLYVVDEVIPGTGDSYVASGKIRRFVQ